MAPVSGKPADKASDTRTGRSWTLNRLDVKSFAQQQAQLEGHETLQKYERLMTESQGLGGDLALNWRAMGEWRASGGTDHAWLHLEADTRVPLTCQRCLLPVETPLTVDRWFRFVRDEATALAEDDEAEEDLLSLEGDFDLQGLIEDELLMELPLVPVHETCPTDVKLAVADVEFEAEATDRPHPFAGLAVLKRDKPGR